MATIRKRSGNWQALVRRLGQKTLSQTFPTKAEAVAWARAKEAEIDVAERPVEVIELATTTLADLIERYRDTVTPTKKSAYQERYRFNRLLREPVVNLTLDKLTTGAFAKFRDDRLQTVGAQQVRHDLNAFAVVLRTARLDWDVPLKSIPVDSVRKPKMPRGRNRRLNDGEYERLRYAILSGESPYLWEVVEFAVQTGMRQAEILGLRWQDINLEARMAHLRDTKNGDPRDVPLTTKAVAVLQKQQEAMYPSPFPFTVRMVQWSWRQARRRAGIEDLHFHDLRHEAISRLFEHGLAIPEVAVISGHRDFRMLARYTHLRAEQISLKLP
ncbi:integrase [Magnetospirillum sulfuroxidans]|uniref:Site-specific integrase n=1 Tax=Magnetospirillum sulfuroxidans TaxID=611300 RepID=A0ABS5IHB0_9PROT|nr:site-specific integrase [Magnetospirillum sulfuroxidans]MBR9973806.1 site-specific integrase [Magnetospirillum sulfuroxidans]